MVYGRKTFALTDKRGCITKPEARINTGLYSTAESGRRGFIGGPFRAAVFRVINTTGIDQLFKAEFAVVPKLCADFNKIIRCDLDSDLAMGNNIGFQLC